MHVYKEALILLRHCSLHGGYDNSAKPSITFQLQYREAGQVKWNKASFSNAEQTVSEANGWIVTWTGLPNTINGKEVTYRVVELTSNGWVQLDKVITPGKEG